MAVTVLLVEDDREQALLFAQVLRMAGYAVLTATTAPEAQQQLDQTPVDLLLADWDLPGTINGDVLIQWTNERHPGVKTVLFSNHPQVYELATSSGADAGFHKIEGIAKLRALLARLAPASA